MSKKKTTQKSSERMTKNTKSKKKKQSGGEKLAALAVAVAMIAVGGLVALWAYGVNSGLIGANAEASNLSVVSESVAEDDLLAAQLAEEEAARKAAEEAERKAAEEEAAKKAAEEALLAAHPELKSSITYKLPTGDTVLDKETLLTWLVDNGDGTYTKNEESWNAHIEQYVNQMANSIDSVGKDRTFQTTGLGTITVNNGEYYGWEVNREAEIEQLTAELNAGTVTEREPNYDSTEAAPLSDNDGIGQNYCEIDASRQHLWIYKDGLLVFETDVVTGLMDESHYTPSGVYRLLSMEQNATLRGERLPNGSYTYETPVSYWMPFTYQGHGLHDAYWKSVFGYGQNEWNGSHGCVNLPAELAGTVYELMNREMPIVIYYSEDYQLRPAPISEVDQYIREAQAAAESEEAARIAAEEAAKAEAEAQKAAEEKAEEERKAAEQKAAEEAAKAAEEAARKAAEEEAARKAAEEAAAQAAAEEAARLAAEEATRAAEEAAAQQGSEEAAP